MQFWPQKTIVSSMLPLCFHQKCMEWNLADIHLPCSEPKSIDNAHLVHVSKMPFFFSTDATDEPVFYDHASFENGTWSLTSLSFDPTRTQMYTHLYIDLRFEQRSFCCGPSPYLMIHTPFYRRWGGFPGVRHFIPRWENMDNFCFSSLWGIGHARY
jgi:hypothetical protein